MLSVRSLSAGYRASDVLHHVSLEVPPSSCVSVIGANGAGKTTLLWSLSGLLSLRSGVVSWRGVDISHLSPAARLRQGMAHCPEGRRVFAHMSVADNLRVGAHTLDEQALVSARMQEAYELFPRLYERRQQSAGTLSGGEQQMLALARALMVSPKLLLLDEPSLGLAPKVVDELFVTITRLCQQKQVSILLVEQNAAMALSISGYAYVLDHGQVVLEGPSTELARDARVRRVYLGG